MDSAFLELERVCHAASNLTVLCVGDAMLDRFIYGKVSRISPEAPIAVLSQGESQTMLGATGNVARNASSLGAQAVVASVVGKDSEGDELSELALKDSRIRAHLVRSCHRKTTVKTRYVSGGQQLLRVDREEVSPLCHAESSELISALEKLLLECDVVLISDYAKGVVTADVIDVCLQVSKARDIPVIVDPKGSDFDRYGAVTLIKPNVSELEKVINQPLRTDEDVEAGLAAALKILPAKAILLTRSEKGMSFLERDGTVKHFPAEKRDVYDVSGAGDTSLAAIGIALSAGVPLARATQFALIASGIAVGKSGTATVTSSEMKRAIQAKQRERVRSGDVEQSLEDLVREWRESGLSVGFTNGCFDILHAGHLSVLEYAAAHCDRLIVGLNSDSSVKRLKGEGRPVNQENDRVRLLKGLKPVDEVVLFSEDTPLELIERIQPDVLVKGGDYTPETVVGADVVERAGGRVLIAPTLDGRSTTGIIERSRSGS
ncbi:MAG: D-glycero-beta-D-manno-heptose 1-phosphate adenylyltransferase [Ponticaulis sp.]|nr:D-glycero-beta-D-manno-heptose 1-phosphate adenylyltransferase [Ponticaulis sp.]